MIHHVASEGNRERICWSCTIDISGKYRNNSNLWLALQMYEDAVEIIESQTSLFKIRDIGEVLVNMRKGYSYSSWNAAANAVHDMAGHGLVRCARYSKNKRQCLQWEVTR